VSIRVAIAARSRKSPDTGIPRIRCAKNIFRPVRWKKQKFQTVTHGAEGKKGGATTAFLKNQHGRDRAATRVHR